MRMSPRATGDLPGLMRDLRQPFSAGCLFGRLTSWPVLVRLALFLFVIHVNRHLFRSCDSCPAVVILQCMTKRTAITIGAMTFASRAAAARFYRAILGRYSPGDRLDEADFLSVLSLCRLKWDRDSKADIEAIIVDHHPAHHQSRCFQIQIGGELFFFSYLLSIHGGLSDQVMSSRACRFAVASRLRDFKKEVFRNRPVRCAVTDEIIEWEDCQVDHKAPLTFSVIVKAFIVAHHVDLERVEYKFDNLLDEFVDDDLSARFRDFHEKMAVLRVLAKGANARLSASARVTPTRKDTALAPVTMQGKLRSSSDVTDPDSS
jgi:Protein of unknown function (DUF3223)